MMNYKKGAATEKRTKQNKYKYKMHEFIQKWILKNRFSISLFKKNWCVFVSLAGSFFTIKLNAYEYEILVLRTSLFNHSFYFGPCSHVTETQGFVQQKKLKGKRKRPKKWNYTLIKLCHPVKCIHRLRCLHFEKSCSLLIAELLNE